LDCQFPLIDMNTMIEELTERSLMPWSVLIEKEYSSLKFAHFAKVYISKSLKELCMPENQTWILIDYALKSLFVLEPRF